MVIQRHHDKDRSTNEGQSAQGERQRELPLMASVLEGLPPSGFRSNSITEYKDFTS